MQSSLLEVSLAEGITKTTTRNEQSGDGEQAESRLGDGKQGECGLGGSSDDMRIRTKQQHRRIHSQLRYACS